MSPRKKKFGFLSLSILAVICGLLSLRRDGLPVPPSSEVSRESVTPSRLAGPQSSAQGDHERRLASGPKQGDVPATQVTKGQVIARFAEWTREYLQAKPKERAVLLAEGVALAQQRRPVFKELIKTDPRQALANAVPMVARQQLPQDIVNQLEERVSGRAVLRVYQSTPQPGEEAAGTTRIAEFQNGGTFSAYVYGRRAEKVTWTPDASLNGVALDRQLAVSEDPLRVLEVGEIPNPAKPAVTVCPVSGQRTEAPSIAAAGPITADTPAVEAYGEIVYLCNGSHTTVYRQTLIQAEGGTGGPTAFTGLLPAAPTPSLGVLRILYIPVTFQDQNAVPTTEGACYNIMRDVGDYYAKSSYGRLTTLTTVTPPIKLPHDEAWYVQKDTSNGGDIDGLGLEQTHARAEARKIGFDDADYDCVVLRLNGGARPTGGWGGGGSVWTYFDSVGIVAHEIGHTFGLAHANFWDTAGSSAIGAGANAEYGDIFDVMGGGGVPTDHYNAQAKNQIKWLPNDYLLNITQSGQYRIYAFDQPSLVPSQYYAMKIVKDSARTYWGEFRQLYTGNTTRPWADKGLILGWNFPNGSGSNIQLIDTTPGSPYGKDDSPISIGRTFSDFESGIHITTLSVSSTTPKYVDFVVNFGSFAGNHAPTLSLASSADFVPTGTTVTFTATASDADGDALAYSWQHFGDTGVRIVSPNSNVITRTFSTAGSYVVSCTVSDMKGGTVTRSKLITVGNGNSRYVINGRVTVGGVGLQGVTMTANGANGVITDSDGYYSIPNLTAGTYVVTPLLYGYNFSELFNNSITVAPNFSGANFSATTDSTLSIAATVPTASETGPVAGKFTITRTGDTSLALAVNVNPVSGSATKATDYAFSPDYVSSSPFSQFTIPAGQASLDITVTPVVDAAIEGPETVTLQLGPGDGYVLGGNTSATVTINDNNSGLPKVSLAATTPSTIENSGQPAVFTFSRTPVTASPLTINYTVTGTATPGTDYTALSGSVTIPANATSATVNVQPIDDTVAEPLETVIATISANAAYIVDSLRTTATVSIVDDDVQIVNVTATDATATEVDLTVGGAQADTATFLVTRSGTDISQPLTVYYSVSGINGTGVGALHGTDYVALPGMVVIPAGETTAAVTITPRFDGIGEGPEKVQFQLGAGPTNYQLGPNNNAVITINDSATDVPYVGVIQMTNAAEPATNGVFRIYARGAGTGTITVNYTMGGSAVAGTDYNIAGIGSTTITLNNGAEVTKDISVVPVNNATADPLRTITMTLTPGASYQMFAPTSSATMWLRDDEQPTVFVDAHQTGTPPTITAGGAASKFYISRTGSTAAALTVNYSMGGTAVNGTDYSAVSGTVIIAAGASGADVVITPLNSAPFSGTRTITLTVTPNGYGVGPSAMLYENGTATNTQKVGFATSGTSGSESLSNVAIPVSLTSAATGTTTVEYWADTGARSSSTSSGVIALPYWVRVVRNGSTFSSYYSTDGTAWVQRGSNVTVAMSSAAYFAGIAVTSASSGTGCTAVVDNVSITGLDSGSVQGAQASTVVGTLSPAGSDSVTAGAYTIVAGGPDISTSGTTDTCRYINFPISNSLNCTLTARIVSLSGGASTAKAGVMIRETVANNSRHASMFATQGSAAYQIYRTASAGNAANANSTNIIKPYWVRLTRVGSTLTAFTSSDGTSFQQTGTPQTITFAPEVLAGLAVSARGDGQLSTATFDNVTISGIASLALQGRTVGFVNAQGSDSVSGGIYTVTGSGNAIGGTEDECHFTAMPVSGDFTLTARVLSQSGTATNAQAGVMIRESGNYRARSAYVGVAATASSEFISRTSTVTNAVGDGIDHTLTSGVLTFNAGDTTQNITFSVNNDTLIEPNENVVITLKNPYNAQLGTITQFTYTIVNDDIASAAPFAGFAATASSAQESTGTAQIWVTLSTPATGPLSVDYAVTGGTAVSGTDFVLANGTLNFAAGESALPITVVLNDNTAANANRTIALTLSNPVNALLGTQTSHTFTIVDDDLPNVSIVATQPNASEAGIAGQFTVTRTGPTTAALTVNCAISGTATNGTDYTTLPTSVTIPVGQSSAVVNVLPTQDSLNEGNETVIVTLSSNAAYNVGSPSNATVIIADDDRPIFNITASQPNAAEGGPSGQFMVTRTGSTSLAVTASVAISGTATNTTDYTTISTSVAFAANQTTAVINVVPVNDVLIEGPETVVLTLNTSGSYDVGANNTAAVTITDNDVPPTIYISSPSAQGALVASGNGLIVTATATDDGLPSPLTYAWTQAGGPGTATFESPSAATSAVTFNADGVYVLKVNVSDGQFTVSDQVTVVVGAAISPADWIAHDLTPSLTQRGQSLLLNNAYTLTGMGAGYGGTTDGAHVMVRPASGTCTIMARLTSVTGAAAAPLAGVTMRDSEYRGARRAVLGYVPGTGLQFRTRTAASSADSVATLAGVALPVWLKLDRDSTTNTITASYATDSAGSPGAWTQVGTPTVIAVDAGGIANIGITATGTSTTNATTAVFDNVTPTPAVSAGGALLAEDGGTGNPTAGTDSYNSATGTWTLSATGALDGGGHFVGRQYFGDFVVTAKLTSASSGALNALSGIMIRESMDSGGYVFLGRITSGSFSGYLWRNYANGSGGGVPSFTQTTRWMRLVRAGNSISAYHAPDSGGSPGVWIPIGQPQTIIMTTPVLVGLAVDNNGGGAVLNTATFTNFSVVPLNKAPIVNTGTIAANAISPLTLSGSVLDDNFPAPPNITTQWSVLSAAGSVAFGNAAQGATTATLGVRGVYSFRLRASDSSVETFRDLTFNGFTKPYDIWALAQFGANWTSPMAEPDADPDGDGVTNFGEYGFSTAPGVRGGNPATVDVETVGSDRYLRVTVPKNPSATELTYVVEATSDLAAAGSWSSAGLVIETNTASQLVVRDSQPKVPGSRRFMRVRVF